MIQKQNWFVLFLHFFFKVEFYHVIFACVYVTTSPASTFSDNVIHLHGEVSNFFSNNRLYKDPLNSDMAS